MRVEDLHVFTATLNFVPPSRILPAAFLLLFERVILRSVLLFAGCNDGVVAKSRVHIWCLSMFVGG